MRSEAAFEESTEYSPTRTSISRTRWNSFLALIEAENDRELLLRTILEIRYGAGEDLKIVLTHAENLST